MWFVYEKQHGGNRKLGQFVQDRRDQRWQR
jgi:hypothetical protein